MIKEPRDCIDAGTEYCPCKLAETGECLICSQLQGECFCDCLNWKGVCIYQELYNNGNKAKEGRKSYICLIKDIINFDDKVVMIKFEAPHKLALDLVRPGSYVFISQNENKYFDIPISVMESNIETNLITVLIEIRGIKTKGILNLNSKDNIIIRGPYWNGVFGIKNVNAQKNNKSLVLARGIGVAPMMPVIRKLLSQNNDVKVVIDKTPFNENFSKELLAKYSTASSECELLDKGKLSDHCKVIIKDALKNGVNYIHISGADILTYEVIEYLDTLNRSDVLLSCCNNFKMCCGEGICGACTARFSGHRVRRFCKEQAEPRSIFEGRRFI